MNQPAFLTDLTLDCSSCVDLRALNTEKMMLFGVYLRVHNTCSNVRP